MLIKNGLVFCEDFALREGDVYTEFDRISEPQNQPEVLDATGCIVAPGFIDIHIHGANGTDFCDSTREAHANIARYLASVGVTSYLGTTMAMQKPVLLNMVRSANEFMDNPVENGAVMRGINLEGPFAAVEKKGAMDPNNLIDPDYDLFVELNEASGGRIRLNDVAPEKPGALDLIERTSEVCVVSLHHTSADYELAKEAFMRGASHVTHLYNAMNGFSHRAPGLIGAAYDFASSVELISDGHHVHPAAVRVAFSIFGEDRVCLISDAMMACGMPNGEYELGGQKVTVTDGLATLASGTIAGSATPLTESFRRAVVEFGIPVESALRAATANPARVLAMEDEIGSIAVGKRADLTLLDAETLEVRHVVLGGKLLF
ncbi:MAG TPA: N-acetylglucosamine-6-phosphate deacetylase [Anaerolineaceae bacterium]|nr:N-acetylglucosamine-6-phosphate deacetylase [Anaerolineaceae bacterium]